MMVLVSLVSSCCRMMNDQDNLDISDHEEKDSMPSDDISEEDKSLTIAEVYNYLVSKQYKGNYGL